MLCFSAISPASASFTGAYDVSNWTISQAPLDADGTVDTTDSPNSITLTSSNHALDDIFGPASNLNFTIAAVAAGNVSFHWSYQTFDEEGSFFDPFGYLLNDVFHQLSPDDLPYLGTASGNALFAVNAGDVFGFRANSVDSSFGSAETTVSDFDVLPPTAVPLPASLWLMGLGLAAIGFRRRQAA
jgi:hypothetical protein